MEKAKINGPKEVKNKVLAIDNNSIALRVIGPNEDHLRLIEQALAVVLASRGNEITLSGTDEQMALAEKSLNYLLDIARVRDVKKSDVTDCLKVFQNDAEADIKSILQHQPIITAKKKISPRTLAQRQYVNAIGKHDIVFGVGPAGTGKTYLAMAVAVSKLLKGDVARIILTRPAVEAGEKLGFLPGDLAEKVNPYLRPLLDALHEMVDYERVERMLATGEIEIAPIAFMRGRTLNDAYVILDEAQNCTREQMKMFLTRLGENSSCVITGDITQIDLPKEQKSGLIQAIKILSKIDGIYMQKFDDRDVVRHPLVAEIIRAYDRDQRIP